MTTPPKEPDSGGELLELCDRLLDGELSADGRARLETLVLGDPGQRKLYVEYMQLHATLRQQSARLSDVPLEAVLKEFPQSAPVFRRSLPRLWRVAAAFVLGAGISGGMWFAQQQAVVATLVEAHGTRWDSSSQPTEAGSKLRPGRLRLAEGLARIVFRNGVELTLEGPAELDLVNRGLCRLHSGALVAHVPEQARGFTVETASARLIDHGTDFGIRADAAGLASVQVINGEVELRHTLGGEPMRLATRQAAAVDTRQLTRIDGGGEEMGRLRQTSGDSIGREFTHEITTATGAGAAAYVSSPGTKIHFSENLLLVKNAKASVFLRKALLRFDLNPVAGKTIESARLTFNFDPTGFGFASLSVDSTFAVYGVTDETQDSWNPKELKWETMPAFSDDAGQVNTETAVKLGTFQILRGVQKGAYFIEGSGLADYLNRDGNHQATVVVVCESQQPQPNGIVYGFAGNNHPSLPPPTLRLRTTP